MRRGITQLPKPLDKFAERRSRRISNIIHEMSEYRAIESASNSPDRVDRQVPFEGLIGELSGSCIRSYQRIAVGSTQIWFSALAALEAFENADGCAADPRLDQDAGAQALSDLARTELSADVQVARLRDRLLRLGLR
jgi:hypothetical protein